MLAPTMLGNSNTADAVLLHALAFRFGFGAGAVAFTMAARSAGRLLLGTVPSSIRSRPDVLAFVPVNGSRSTLPMSVQPCRMCGSMAACSDVRIKCMAAIRDAPRC